MTLFFEVAKSYLIGGRPTIETSWRFPIDEIIHCEYNFLFPRAISRRISEPPTAAFIRDSSFSFFNSSFLQILILP